MSDNVDCGRIASPESFKFFFCFFASRERCVYNEPNTGKSNFSKHTALLDEGTTELKSSMSEIWAFKPEINTRKAQVDNCVDELGNGSWSKYFFHDSFESLIIFLETNKNKART